eukprot:9388358-Pyramimonas_sp.AAC.1
MIVPWLINYAGTVLSLFEAGASGCTAYERLRGKKYRKELPPCAETVFYLPADLYRGHKNKLDAKWLTGIYLG